MGGSAKSKLHIDNRTDGQIWVLTGIERTGRRVALLGRLTRELIRGEKDWVEHTYKTLPRYHHNLKCKQYTYGDAAMLEWWGPIPECLRLLVTAHARNVADAGRTGTQLPASQFRRTTAFLLRLISGSRLAR